VESKINVRTLKNDYTNHTSQNLPKKVNRLNQTFEKLTVQQSPDNIGNAFSLELIENNFQFSDTFQAIVVFAGVFALVYIFGLKSFKKSKRAIHGFLSECSAVKRFILICLSEFKKLLRTVFC